MDEIRPELPDHQKEVETADKLKGAEAQAKLDEVLKAKNFRYTELLLSGNTSQSGSEELTAIEQEIKAKMDEKIGPGWEAAVLPLHGQLAENDVYTDIDLKQAYKEVKRLFYAGFELGSSAVAAQHAEALLERVLKTFQEKQIFSANLAEDLEEIKRNLYVPFTLGIQLHHLTQIGADEPGRDPLIMPQRESLEDSLIKKPSSTDVPAAPDNQPAPDFRIEGNVQATIDQINQKLAEQADKDKPTDDIPSGTEPFAKFVNSKDQQ